MWSRLVIRRLLLPALAGALLATPLTSCSRASGQREARTIQVPSDASSISAAVAAAKPGDTILVAPGTYHESVRVDVAGITIRGEDRNTVVLDGRDTLANGIAVSSNDVAVENLTVHSYTQNGVVFNGIDAASDGKDVDPGTLYGTGDAVLTGYRVSYVTSYNNGLYGIYAFASRDGLIEDSYVSGHPDSGVYVGQCRPCNVVIRRVTAEYNAIGYYGTNSSGGVYVIESTFRKNRLGIAPNSQKAENLAPQAEAVVAGNLVVDNSEATAPRIPQGFFGVGIAIGGGTRNTVVRNRVSGNTGAGIYVLSLNDYLPTGNRVEGNVLESNGTDLVYAPTGATGAGDNCFTGNTFVSSFPDGIERVMACGVTPSIAAIGSFATPVAPPDRDYRTLPVPPSQLNQPTIPPGTPAGAGPVPAVDLAAIKVPAR